MSKSQLSQKRINRKASLVILLCGLAPFAAAKWAHGTTHGWVGGLAQNSIIHRAISLVPKSIVGQAASAPASVPASIRAAQRGAPFVSFRDGASVPTHYQGDSSAASALQNNLAQPLALASADFDGDGVPDLVSGYSTGGSGIITIHRGNVNALWPYGAALLNGEPPAFLPNASAFVVPEPPDFIGAGDFDADGHWDIVTAHLGSNSLYFLRGDGHGDFAAPQRIALSGSITAFTTGEINRADGLTDIAVGVSGGHGASVLIFESPLGALRGAPETFALPSAATSMAFGMVEGGPMRDLAVAAGNQLVVIHGRDRRLSLGSAGQASVAPARISQQALPFSIRALSLGHFSDTASLAALGDDSAVHLIQNSNAISQAIKQANTPPAMQVSAHGNAQKPAPAQATTPASRAQKAAVLQNLRKALAANRAEWRIEADVPVPATAANQGTASIAKLMVTARVSTSHYDDLLLLDGQSKQVHVLSSQTTRTLNASAGVTAQTVSQPMALAATLDATGSPAAILPMRLNKHGLQGLVVLQGGQAVPTVVPPAPANIFTVTNTSDIATSSLDATIPPGSLRAAITNATNADGPSEIDFNIPTSDPNYNATTGVFLIRPLSTVPPGNFDDFALPPIAGTVTVDGYTQPGASPNTLVTGDNAKILIQIDGSMALTPGGGGFNPFDTSETVIRGFSITGWTLSDNSNPNQPTGSIGLAEGGVSDFMEGNFVGVNPDGITANANSEGVNDDAGPGLGAPSASFGGDVLGGTTPQARNLISGNTGEGVVAEPGSYLLQIQGNYIGTDLTGTIVVPNIGDGVFVPGEEVTVGGVLPGAGNLVSGNTNYNIDIGNGFPNGSASDDMVQGNFVGTDATGTNSLSNFGTGVGIVNIASNITLGGTTPTARNIISGNNFLGVDIADNSSNAIVQGNYIGLDVTGTKAIPNGLGGLGSNNVPSGGIAINTHSFISAGGTPFLYPPFNNAIGGGVAGARNVISGNGGDGVSIMGWDNNDPNEANPNNLANFVLGNFIGTDVTGNNAVPNTQNGVYLTMDVEANSPAAHNAIGGTDPGLGNIISFNGGSGVLIDGTSSSNPIIGNSIQNNIGTGIRIVSGNGNQISRNSIFGNGALGIDLGTSGPNANSSCQATVTGANNSQNAPVLSAGAGSVFISATATDSNGNTSEFSNSVAATLSGNNLTLLGTFNSLPSTTYTIEFFSSPTADSSGFGQGQTFLNSTSITTAANCTGPISTTVNTTQADISVSLSYSENGSPQAFSQLAPGTDFGSQVYTAVVTNIGPATAHNVVFTDPLPAGLAVSGMYCNLPSCESPLSTNLGNCTVSANTVTCPLGTMAAGSSATIKIPVQALATGTITNSVNAVATETDPNTANNTASTNVTSQNPFTQVTQVSPTGLLTSAPTTTVIVYGTGFIPGVSVVTFTDPNNVSTVLPVTGFYDNQICGVNSNVSTTSYCQGFQVTLPSSLIGTAGAASFTVTNPGGPFALAGSFTLASACDFGNPFLFYTSPYDFSNAGSGLIPFELDVEPNVPSCTFTASSDAPWAVLLNNSPEPFGLPGIFVVDFAIAPNPGSARSGNLTVAGQTLAITQDANDGTACSMIFNPPSATLPATAGSYTVQVTPASPSCSYFNNSASSWITVDSADSLVSGPVTVGYTVTANTGGPQIGDIVMGGQAFVITQNAASNCYFTLSSNSATFPTIAGTGSVNVTASLPTCPWTATTDSPSYVSITSGGSGTGNGTIQYSVAANTGGQRIALITAGNTQGSSAALTITQASTFACFVTLSPSSIELPAEGVTNRFTVTPGFTNCGWTAVSNNPSDLVITSGTSGSGDPASINFVVAQNLTGAPRTLTITAGCRTFTVNQDGPAVASNPFP